MSASNKFYFDKGIGKAELIVGLICIAIAGFALAFTIIAYTPLRNLIPGYPTSTIKRQQVETLLRIDSLERSINRWQLYSENLRRVVEGEQPISLDSVIRQFNASQSKKEIVDNASADSTLRAYVQDKEETAITKRTEDSVRDLDGMLLFQPLLGTVSRHFEMSTHPYVDVTAPEGSTVKAILEGNVIFTGWSEMEGWCIILQHENGIISVYKNNQKILKKAADRVNAGTAIAILGKSGEDAYTGTHLHFELWQNGSPVDPEQFITF